MVPAVGVGWGPPHPEKDPDPSLPPLSHPSWSLVQETPVPPWSLPAFGSHDHASSQIQKDLSCGEWVLARVPGSPPGAPPYHTLSLWLHSGQTYPWGLTG